MILELVLASALAIQCKVVWLDAGNGKRYETVPMSCPEAHRRKEIMEQQKPSLRVWVERAKGRKK